MKPLIFLLCIDSSSIQILLDVKKALEERSDCSVHFINVRGMPPGGGSWLLEDYPAFRQTVPANLYDNAQYIRETYQLEPSTYYRSDLRFYSGQATEHELCIESRYVLDRTTALLDDFQPTYVFMPGGGNLYGNLFFEIAQRSGVIVFRIYPFHWINVEKGSRRYFFSDNLWFEMKSNENMVGTQFYNKALEKAYFYYDAVLRRRHYPDKIARTVAVKNRFSPDFPGFLKDLAGYTIKSIIHRTTHGRRGRGHTLHAKRIASFCSRSYSQWRKKPIDWRDKFFIYILHQPADSQLAFRGFPFVDQIATCRLIMANLPSGTRLYIKEHPVHPGMISIRDLNLLHKEFGERCKFLNSSFSFRELAKRSIGVITINSTATLEAMIIGVPVVVLGRGIYQQARSIHRIEKIYEIQKVLTEVLVKPRIASREDVIELLARALCHCVPGPEIEGDDTVSYIADGILKRMERF